LNYSMKMNNNSITEFIVDWYNKNKKIDPSFTWENCADEVYRYYGVAMTGGACRARYSRARRAGVSNEDQPEQLLIDDPAFQEKIETVKAKFKSADEKTQLNAMLRRVSREETIKDIAKEVAETFNKKFSFTLKPDVLEQHAARKNEEREAILQLSDWHYGICIDSPYNQYNPDICKERVMRLAKEVAQRCALYDIHKLHVVNLGDMIAGRIHLTLRLKSRFDVITQTIEVSELLANFMFALSSFLDIEYYDTLDNHSRLEPNLCDSLDLESLVRIITWFLKERLKDVPTIHFNDNTLGDDIASFTCLGHKVIAVHGDKDKPETVVANLSLMTKDYYDLALTAHRHHFFTDEKNRTVVVSNSSLMGTDDLAQQLRLSAAASQNLIIATKKNVVDTICRINVE